MDASFTIDLDEESPLKPLPYSLGKRTKSKREMIKLPETYPKFEVEFFDVIKSCAEYIDKIHCVETRIKLNKELNKIFILRHKGSAMRMFMELVNSAMSQKRR